MYRATSEIYFSTNSFRFSFSETNPLFNVSLSSLINFHGQYKHTIDVVQYTKTRLIIAPQTYPKIETVTHYDLMVTIVVTDILSSEILSPIST